MHRSRIHRLSARAALVWLVLALAWAPTLGRWHQVAHAEPLGQMQTGQTGHAGHAPHGAAQQHGHVGGAAGTFLAHHAPADCLLLDQLALGSALHTIAVAVPAVAPVQAAPLPPADRVGARHVALFQARGPPAA